MANTVIFKWNPAISSYSMLEHLQNIVREEPVSDWSVWDHEHVRRGDLFYMLKVGCGQTGIVMRGKILTDPFTGEDWSRRGREVYYAEYRAEFMINPDTFSILNSEALLDAIPGFDWYGGHSGVILEPEQADVLDRMWNAWLEENKGEFQARFELMERRKMWNDQLYLSQELQNRLFRID